MTAPAWSAVTLKGVDKAFGTKPALQAFDLEVQHGQCVLLLGPNGAGKSTVLRTIATLARPDAGHVSVMGHDVSRNGEMARQLTGALLHSPMLYADLTVRENLRFHARLFRISNPEERIELAARLAGVQERLDDRVRALSHGYAKRAGLARAVLHDPSVLLLDEPESGLDQAALSLLDALLESCLERGRTVIMTTHQMDRAVEHATRFVVIVRGSVVLDHAGPGITKSELQRIYAGITMGET